MTVLYFLVIAAAAYFFGGLNGAIITSRLVYRDDIRTHGSGNPGLTNFYRTYGPRAIFLLILIDVLKTAIPVVIGGEILKAYADFGTVTYRIIIGRTWGGLFAMLGHAYPCMLGLKGGKCVLAGGTAALFINFHVGLFVWSAFLIAVLITRYVSLGSILAAALFPISFLILGYTGWPLVLSAMCGGLLIYRHRENILRLIRGEERKFSFKRSQESSEKKNKEDETL